MKYWRRSRRVQDVPVRASVSIVVSIRRSKRRRVLSRHGSEGSRVSNSITERIE